MRKIKLVQLFLLLDSADIKQFHLYLDSPIFNKREDLKALAIELEKRFVKSDKEWTEEAIWKKVYPKTEFHASKFNNLKTALQNLLLKFMAFSEFEKQPAVQQRFLLQKLIELGDEKYFPSFFEKAKKQLDGMELREDELFLEKMMIEGTWNNFHDLQPKRDANDHLGEIAHHLGNAFLLRMYRLIMRNLERDSIVGGKLELTSEPLVVAFVEAQKSELPVVILAYHEWYKMKTSDEPEVAYRALRELMKKAGQQLSANEALNIHTGLINFAAQKLNDGKIDFLKELFLIYVEMLKLGLLLEDGKMSPWHFQNIVNVALRSKQFEWTAKFLDDYGTMIRDDLDGNLWQFCNGLLHFHKKEFDKAEKLFNRLLDDFVDVFYGIDARAYLLQIYYETGNSLGLESLTHSFRMYLDRSKSISDERRRQYITFISHLKRLTNIPLRDKQRLEKLREDILGKSSRGMGISWLLEKIAELE